MAVGHCATQTINANQSRLDEPAAYNPMEEAMDGSIANGSDAEPTQAMRKKDTAMCFKALRQTTEYSRILHGRSFEEQMQIEAKGFKI